MALVWGSCIIFVSSPFAVRRRRTRRTTRQSARHQSVCVFFSGLCLGAYLVRVSETRPFGVKDGLLTCVGCVPGMALISCLFIPLVSSPFAVRRRRTRWRPRSCQRRDSTTLSCSAFDEGLAFKLATHMVADLDELSRVKTPQSLAALSRTHEFDPPQRPHQGPPLPRGLTFLDHCKKSPGMCFRRFNVRPQVREALIRWRAHQEACWDERVRLQVS